MNNPILETSRLYMREILPSDETAMFRLDSDPIVHKYVGATPVKDIQQIRDVINMIRKQYFDNGIGRWAVITKDKNEFIGWAGLKLIKTRINNFVDHYDVGYRFIPEYWGKGYATECAKASVEYGFEALGQKQLHAYTHFDNVISEKVLYKVGFQYVNEFDDEGDRCKWFTATR